LPGRKVLAFLSQAHVEPDITMEIFFVDAPLEGFGAVEITAREEGDQTQPAHSAAVPGVV
jgi:hypothetical protein